MHNIYFICRTVPRNAADHHDVVPAPTGRYILTYLLIFIRTEHNIIDLVIIRFVIFRILTSCAYLRCCGCDASRGPSNRSEISIIFRAAAAAFVLIRQGSFGTVPTLNAYACATAYVL